MRMLVHNKRKRVSLQTVWRLNTDNIRHIQAVAFVRQSERFQLFLTLISAFVRKQKKKTSVPLIVRPSVCSYSLSLGLLVGGLVLRNENFIENVYYILMDGIVVVVIIIIIIVFIILFFFFSVQL